MSDEVELNEIIKKDKPEFQRTDFVRKPIRKFQRPTYDRSAPRYKAYDSQEREGGHRKPRDSYNGGGRGGGGIRTLEISRSIRPIQIKYLDTNISTKDIMDIATKGDAAVKISSVKTQTEETRKGLKIVGIIKFQKKEDAESLIKEYNGAKLEGNTLEIQYVQNDNY